MGDMHQPVCRTWQNYTLSPAGAAEARLVSITHVSWQPGVSRRVRIRTAF